MEKNTGKVKPETDKAKKFNHVWRVVGILSPREKKKLLIIFAGAIFMALIEVMGIGSIMPFMAVASRPEIIHTNEYLSWIYQWFGFRTDQGFLIFLGIGLLGFLVLTNASHALMHYMRVRFTSLRRHTLSVRLLQAYLGQPYTFFLNKNSFDFVKNINGEIQNMITGTLIQLVDIVAKVIQITLLVAFLFIVNPSSTLIVVMVVGILYGLIYTTIRKLIRRLGVERFERAQDIARVVSEAFWGIKEVKLAGIEASYVKEFVGPSKRLALNASTTEVIGDVPKYALETVAFSSILLIVLISIAREGSFANAAATVSLFAYAGYRMIPAVQGLFKAITKLKHSAPTAERLITEFSYEGNAEQLVKNAVPRLAFQQSIELRNIQYSYPSTESSVIKGISLNIPVNSLIGFAGKTGSGKTTLVDIILGLLRPSSGGIYIDGQLVTEENLRSWQANIGYVPQNIYLSNESIATNIAFGVPKAQIDMEAVQRAASLAQIHSFITDELKDGYQTMIGERGIRLSGGQRQRIGIARALYRNPSVLIMDEATSALDNHTEKAVMEAIDSLHGTRTIVLIAHRLSTLRECDQIYIMDNGTISGFGSYFELEMRDNFFKLSR